MNNQKIKQLERDIEVLAYVQPRLRTWQERQEGMRKIVKKQVEYFQEKEAIQGYGEIYRPRFRYINGDGRSSVN